MSLKEKLIVGFAIVAILAANFMIMKASAIHERNEQLEAEINDILATQAVIQNLRRQEYLGNKD